MFFTPVRLGQEDGYENHQRRLKSCDLVKHHGIKLEKKNLQVRYSETTKLDHSVGGQNSLLGEMNCQTASESRDSTRWEKHCQFHWDRQQLELDEGQKSEELRVSALNCCKPFKLIRS